MKAKTTNDISKQAFWAMPVLEVVGFLRTDVQNGLSEDEAKQRLQAYGPNVIEKPKRAAGLLIFLRQFRSPLILILLLASAITFFIGHYRDTSFIMAAVLVNAILGFYQEYKAEKALSELKTYLKQRTRAIRSGKEREMDAAGLVPGDIIHVAQGDRIPADGRVMFANDLQVDEAILTGESLPASKLSDPVSADVTIGDQSSMVFAGTLVTQGVGTVVICQTRFSTELGRIANLVAKSMQEETPLQAAIRRFSIRAGIFLGALTLIIFFVGLALGYSRLEMFLTSVAIAVSAVPEGLPVALTVILAIGVQRMARRKGVIRKLVAAETLGSTTIILTDKTGTLTMAKMELNEILPVAGMKPEHLLEMALINTSVLVENSDEEPSKWRMSGRILESSLVRSAALRGVFVDDVKDKNYILSSLPFNAANKFSASLIRDGEGYSIIFFGAPDVLLGYSTLNDEERSKALEQIDSLASSGQLVVGIAAKPIESGEGFSLVRDLKLFGLSFQGLITLRDPVRPRVKDAIQNVRASGVRVVIVTGDHRGTAESVAKDVGLLVGNEGALDSSGLKALSDEDLQKILPSLQVISRVSPLDKMRIVRAFQESGEIVAMTGDGVNDAPSIKQANIGIAMGSGTEVSRDVADLVLLDDNFETIAAAVEEGRQIMSNIRKVLVYLLSDVADELFLIGGALATGLALPLNALQILWVNFFSDSFPAVAFAFEKDASSLSRYPYSLKRGLFDLLTRFLVLFVGLSTSALLFALYWLLLRFDFPEDIVRTFIFAGFGSYTLFLAFSVRNLGKSIFTYNALSNRYLNIGVVIGLFLMGAAVYVPFLQSLLGTVALPVNWLLGVLVIGMLNIAMVELGKWIYRRKLERI